ncbi:unnamed protein product [Fusarium graminearum]|uniref:Chromosome 2, complete genome n=2 Tax=Gibberella zeae TaxID=5518 RepID=A0A098DDC1_GIBZE|nr:unnamed protein product [Fusarium graminearum]CAF3482712.1 unnamed protein product [Fusarium graminearum]CAF3496823.1 unnamed protein product [Fusarium graminearum]CAG1975850.1 unnamed protein product [Fusarium graminearum]CAG1990102.1 unnamed protein product [Fusarium graminearum]
MSLPSNHVIVGKSFSSPGNTESPTGRVSSEALRIGTMLSLESELSFLFRLRHPLSWSAEVL